MARVRAVGIATRSEWMTAPVIVSGSAGREARPPALEMSEGADPTQEDAAHVSTEGSICLAELGSGIEAVFVCDVSLWRTLPMP